jgi:hypothetical protein
MNPLTMYEVAIPSRFCDPALDFVIARATSRTHILQKDLARALRGNLQDVTYAREDNPSNK